MLQVCWPCLSQEPSTLVPFLSGCCTSPNTNTHPEASDVGVFVKSDLDESAISSEDISKLVHGCTPAEALVDMIKDVVGVSFFDRYEVLVNSISQALGSRHQASPRRAARLMRLRMLVVTVGAVDWPGWCHGVHVMSLLRAGSFPLADAYTVVVRWYHSGLSVPLGVAVMSAKFVGTLLFMSQDSRAAVYQQKNER